MGAKHAETLRLARGRMVEDRRALAEVLAKPYDREKTPGARENMVKVQQAIDAIDAAMEDEEGASDVGDYLRNPVVG